MWAGESHCATTIVKKLFELFGLLDLAGFSHAWGIGATTMGTGGTGPPKF
jgi:hypothetical protein